MYWTENIYYKIQKDIINYKCINRLEGSYRLYEREPREFNLYVL